MVDRISDINRTMKVIIPNVYKLYAYFCLLILPTIHWLVY